MIRSGVHIALATCRTLPSWEVDDAPLEAALRSRGVTVHAPAWDDPAFDFSRMDACLIRTTWDYTDRREAFVAWAERTALATRFFNAPHIVRWNTHKSYLRDLEQEGVPVVPTCWLAPGEKLEIERLMRDLGWTCGFIKPAIGSTARETLRFHAKPDDLRRAQAHAERLLKAGESLLLQPYLTSVESVGEYSAIFIGGEFSHAVRKVPVKGDYRVQDDFGAHDEPAVIPNDHLDMATHALHAAMRITVRLDPRRNGANRRDRDAMLIARVDFLLDQAGLPRVSEFEAVEPSLFFRHGPRAADRLAHALLTSIGKPE